MSNNFFLKTHINITINWENDGHQDLKLTCPNETSELEYSKLLTDGNIYIKLNENGITIYL